jgi:G3E family GTPase
MIPVAGISDIYESVNVVFSDLGDVSIEYGSLCGQVEYTVYISVFEDVANACVCCTTSLKEEYFLEQLALNY